MLHLPGREVRLGLGRARIGPGMLAECPGKQARGWVQFVRGLPWELRTGLCLRLPLSHVSWSYDVRSGGQPGGHCSPLEQPCVSAPSGVAQGVLDSCSTWAWLWSELCARAALTWPWHGALWVLAGLGVPGAPAGHLPPCSVFCAIQGLVSCATVQTPGWAVLSDLFPFLFLPSCGPHSQS